MQVHQPGARHDDNRSRSSPLSLGHPDCTGVLAYWHLTLMLHRMHCTFPYISTFVSCLTHRTPRLYILTPTRTPRSLPTLDTPTRHPIMSHPRPSTSSRQSSPEDAPVVTIGTKGKRMKEKLAARGERQLSPVSYTFAESVDNLHLWSDGDMTIHSADGVTFRVQSYHLLSASSVFRDLFAIGSGPRELSLSDESIETAPVLRMFLDLVTLGRLHVYLPPSVVEAEPTELRAIRALYALVHFLQKYECRVQLRTVLVEVRQRVDTGDWPPFLGFVVGAVADDERTWSGALQHRTTTWDRYIENVTVSWTAMNVRRLLGQSTLDPRCLPYDFWIMCPPEFMWALTVSWAGKDCPPEIFHLQVRTTLADLRKGRCRSRESGELTRTGEQNRMSQYGLLGQGLASDTSSRPNTPSV